MMIAKEDDARALRRWWSPEARIFAISFLILYLELAVIRWVTGYVHNFGYFTNFAMLAAFLGVGIGCLLAGRRAALACLPSFLTALALIVHFGDVQIDLAVTSQNAVFWSEAMRADGKVGVTSAVAALFLLIALVFVGLGQPLGDLFAELPRLRAYGYNVLGGLAGILLFAANSYFAHPPLVWFVTAAVLAAPFLAATPRPLWPAHAILLLVFLAIVGISSRGDTWSPYYRQTLIKTNSGYLLAGNGIPGINIAGWDGLDNPFMYEMPYGEAAHRLRKHPDAPIRRALVIGCGGGNDVAMALQNHVGHVDAIDINPWVIEMGKMHHPLRPFDSPDVTTYVADGREFLARAGDNYDLIVYGLPDSTFTDDRSNLRVESFIFTAEAFAKVRSRLTDDGVFVVYNYYRVPWLVSKIDAMLRDAFDQEPLLVMFTRSDGQPHPMVPAGMMVGPGLELPAPVGVASPAPATDDWPFLYLKGPTVPSTYVRALLAVGTLSVLLVLGALRATRPSGGRVAETPLLLATLFFMGVAFTLLETRSVVTFGLLFGSTWWNNVVVFSAIHVSVLLAVLVNARFPGLPRSILAAALLASLAFAWALPPEALLVRSPAARAVLAGTVAFLPIFCANVLFASVFGSAREGRVSYAFNLLGGMLGGLLEYASLLLGYRALIGIALVFYLGALLFMSRHALRRRAGAT